jgi:hypothetical protein
MSKFTNPSELVERYLQAVRFWLPKSARQDDLLAELGEDLRSQIESREAELGRALNEDEASAILKRCGVPIVVAGRIGPHRQLIGPTLFPIYTFVLKMVLFWILVPVFLFIVGPANVAENPGQWATAVVVTFGQLWSGLFIAAGIITIVFAAIEYTHAYAGVEAKWDPLKLPPVPRQQQKVSRAKTACELGFGFFGLIWVLLLPTYPVLILGPAAAFLKAAPLVHTLFVPIVLLSVLSVARSAVILARPQWTSFPLWTQLLQAVLTLILINFMLNAAGTPASPADWHPFVVAVQTVHSSVNYVHIAAIVNASILMSMAAAWIGLSIAMIVHLWQLLSYVRKRITGTHQAVSLHVQ